MNHQPENEKMLDFVSASVVDVEDARESCTLKLMI